MVGLAPFGVEAGVDISKLVRREVCAISPGYFVGQVYISQAYVPYECKYNSSYLPIRVPRYTHELRNFPYAP